MTGNGKEGKKSMENMEKTGKTLKKQKRKKRIAVAAAAMGLAALVASGSMLAANTVVAAEELSAFAESTVLQASVDTEIRAVYKNTCYNDTGCTLMLPTGYVASGEVEGMYLSERHPLDSSNIYYTVSEGIDADVLEDAMESEEYRQKAEQEFRDAYGENASVTDYRMTKTEIDGCPAYKIELSCKVDDMQMDQLVYIIAADKVYTVTYSQSADDERMEDFKKSAETIQVVFGE